MPKSINFKNQNSTNLDGLRNEKSSCRKLSTSNAKILAVASGIFLILGSIALLAASLFLVPQSLNALQAWKIGCWIGSTLLLSVGTICILFGTLKGISCSQSKQTLLKATDSVNEYSLEDLKKITDFLVLRSPERVSGYEVLYEDCIDTGALARVPRLPQTQTEIEDYMIKIPSIVQGVREYLENTLSQPVPIPKIIDALKMYWKKNPRPIA